MASNIPSCGMGTTIVQSAYQKCLELHDFVPIFLKFFWGRTPRPPSLPGISKGYFEILALLKTCLCFFLVVFLFWQNYPPPPFLLKSKKKKKKKKKKRAPPFLKSWIRHWIYCDKEHLICNGTCYKGLYSVQFDCINVLQHRMNFPDIIFYFSSYTPEKEFCTTHSYFVVF